MDISKNMEFSSSEEDGWILDPAIKLPEISEQDQWMAEKSLAKLVAGGLLKHAKDGKPWVALFDMNTETETIGPIMLDEFRRFFLPVFQERGNGKI